MSDPEAMTPAQKRSATSHRSWSRSPTTFCLATLGTHGAVQARPQPDHGRGTDHERQYRTAPGPPRAGQGQRSEGGRAQGGHHPPGVLRRLASGDVRRHRREGDLRRLTAAGCATALQSAAHLTRRKGMILGSRL